MSRPGQRRWARPKADSLVGVVGLFIVTDEHADDSGTLTFKKTARLVKSDSVNPVGKSVTFDFWEGREPLVVAGDVLLESLIRHDAELTPV